MCHRSCWNLCEFCVGLLTELAQKWVIWSASQHHFLPFKDLRPAQVSCRYLNSEQMSLTLQSCTYCPWSIPQLHYFMAPLTHKNSLLDSSFNSSELNSAAMWKDESLGNAKSEEMQLEHPTWPVLKLALSAFAQIPTKQEKVKRVKHSQDDNTPALPVSSSIKL